MSSHLFEASSAESPSLPAEGQKRGEAGDWGGCWGGLLQTSGHLLRGDTMATTLYPAKISETPKN